MLTIIPPAFCACANEKHIKFTPDDKHSVKITNSNLLYTSQLPCGLIKGLFFKFTTDNVEDKERWLFQLAYINHRAHEREGRVVLTLTIYIRTMLFYYRALSEGDNVLVSVHPSVCPSTLSLLNRLTYDLDIWQVG